MKQLRRQHPFLNGILKVANRFKRQDVLQHANKDQINAISEMVLKLKKCILIDARTYWKLKRQKPVERSGETQKLGKTSKRTSHRNERKRILEWFTRLFSSMLGMTLKGRDDQGYPREGSDVVPDKKPPPPPRKWRPLYAKDKESIPALVQLLQDANKREAQLKDSVEYWNQRYHSLYQDTITLKYGNLCKTCQTTQPLTPPGKTITLCRGCREGKKTIQTLKDNEISYWQDCYKDC